MSHGTKFPSGKSYMRPYFVDPLRERNGKLHYDKGSSKFLKRINNRKLRRQPVDAVASGCAYKRLVEIWDYNGDLPNGLHHYAHPYPGDAEMNHVITKGGKRYFPKK